MRTYDVLLPLRRDGKTYLSGAELELSIDEATPLVKCGTLAPTSAPADSAEGNPDAKKAKKAK